jgi:hypothetical protein
MDMMEFGDRVSRMALDVSTREQRAAPEKRQALRQAEVAEAKALQQLREAQQALTEAREVLSQARRTVERCHLREQASRALAQICVWPETLAWLQGEDRLTVHDVASLVRLGVATANQRKRAYPGFPNPKVFRTDLGVEVAALYRELTAVDKAAQEISGVSGDNHDQ